MSCKAVGCKHKASRRSGFCGWCDKKYKSGTLLPDGREAAKVCRAKVCDRPAKKEGFCGWCHRKFLKGAILADGSFSIEEERKFKKQAALKESRAKRAAKKEISSLKKELKVLIDYERLKMLQDQHEDYRKSTDCPYLKINISPAACFNRMFLYEYAPKKCKKCDQYDHKLVELKQRTESIK